MRRKREREKRNAIIVFKVDQNSVFVNDFSKCHRASERGRTMELFICLLSSSYFTTPVSLLVSIEKITFNCAHLKKLQRIVQIAAAIRVLQTESFVVLCETFSLSGKMLIALIGANEMYWQPAFGQRRKYRSLS